MYVCAHATASSTPPPPPPTTTMSCTHSPCQTTPCTTRLVRKPTHVYILPTTRQSMLGCTPPTPMLHVHVHYHNHSLPRSLILCTHVHVHFYVSRLSPLRRVLATSDALLCPLILTHILATCGRLCHLIFCQKSRFFFTRKPANHMTEFSKISQVKSAE